jgi:hypothetical protein
VNRVNAPTSAVGTAPFIGDYPDAVPFLQFVLDEGRWRWAIEPGDVPSRGFHTVWADNRHLIPPTEAPEEPVAKVAEEDPDEWDLYKYYGPPRTGEIEPCYNPGSRNTDVLTSRVDTETIVSAPTTFKQLDAVRSFPFSVSNKTDEFRQFQIDIVSANEFTSLSPIEGVDQDSYDVEVFPFSSSALTVYVTPPAPPDPPDPNVEFDPTAAVGPIRVEVQLLATKAGIHDEWLSCESDCAVGSITFNADPDNPPLQNLGENEEESFGPSIGDAFVINYNFENAFVINGGVDNAFVINEGAENAFVINSGEENAFVINAFVINAFVINQTIYEVTDTVWEMEASGSNTSANYVPLINIDNAEKLKGKYAFQLIVDKASSFGTLEELVSEDPCDAYTASVSQQQVLANVVQDPTAENAFVINNSPENAFVINNQVDNAFVINSSFAMAPSDSVAKTTRATAKVNGIDDSATKAPPPSNKYRVTLRAWQLVPDSQLPPDPYTGAIIEYNPAEHPPSIVAFHQACDPEETDPTKQCLARIGADLVIVQNVEGEEPDPQAIDTTPLTAAVCGTVDFPAFTMRNVGNADADPRSGKMRHGIFLSADDVLDLGVDRLLTDPFADPPQDIRSTINPLAGMNEDPPSGNPYEESFPSTPVTLPPDVTGGTYYLILYVDYPREASEYDETNNTVAIKVNVEASYLFHGLQPPTDYTLYVGNAGSAVPLLWEYVGPDGLPVDSADAQPVVSVEGWVGQTCAGDLIGDPVVYFESNPEDPGSSGLRYDPLLKKWQINLQTKAPMEPGCFHIYVSSVYQCENQPDGPFPLQLN